MKNNIIMAFVLITVLAFSTITIVQAAGTPPTGGPGTGMGNQTPPTGGQNGPSAGAGNDTQPLKERLQAFYDDKETYIEQKRQCKEEVLTTNAPSGTCWNRLKPLMVALLQKEVVLTQKRIVQLQGKNITIPNIADISTKLKNYMTIFSDSSSSKYLLKSTAKNLEDLINQIEDIALQGQTDKLIKQMDNLMIKADEITTKLDAKLIELRAAGVNVAELENSLNQYKEELAKTKQSIADAKAKYAQMGSSADISQLAKDVRTFINNAQNYLVKAFDKAKKMIPSIGDSEGGGDNQGSGDGGNNGGNNGGDNGGPQGGSP